MGKRIKWKRASDGTALTRAQTKIAFVRIKNWHFIYGELTPKGTKLCKQRTLHLII